MTYNTSATRWNHGIQGRREGCAKGESRPGRWIRRGAASLKKKFKITVLFNTVGVFLSNIVGSLTCFAPYLYHRRMATGILLVFIIIFRHKHSQIIIIHKQLMVESSIDIN